ncbi:hypothetical protein B2J88_49185 [Rhodococcus sp. SRB_17]|nr:hypothetical protein [Rhodococcus sp. SRB_17]
MEDKTSHGASGHGSSTNGGSANGGSTNGLTNGSNGSNGSRTSSSAATTDTLSVRPIEDALSTGPTGAFTFPLPDRSTAAHSSGEDPSMPAPTPTPSRESSRTLETRSRTVVRRDAMGVAAVRVAGRLTHTELIANHSSPSGTYSADPTINLDELLTMLGSYLLSSGFEHPEIHAKLGGQSIVVNLVSPEISAT